MYLANNRNRILLKIVFIKRPLLSISFFILSGAWAAPPQDFTKPELITEKKFEKKTIRDEDLVFQDVNDPLPTPDKDIASVRVDVVGRGLPFREGKAILRLMQFDKVKVLKTSNDGRWLAIQALRSGRKAWVPKVAIQLPEVEARKARSAEVESRSLGDEN